MESYDAVIVGAGLAGLQCAQLLAAQQQRVLLLDRKEDLSQRIHTTGIFVRRTLDDFDIPESLLGAGVRRIRLIAPSGRAIELQSRQAEFRVGRMGPLYQHWLNRAVEHGAQWSPATSFVSATPDEADSVVQFERDGCSRSVRTRFVIGADGAASRVAPQLNLSENREWIVGVEQVYAIGRLRRPPALHCFLDPLLAPGYLAWIAEDGEEAHVGVGGYPGRFQVNEALDRFLAGPASKVLPLSDSDVIERRGGRIPVGGVLPKIVNARGLLVGDAAGAVSPLTAGGLDPCMRLSALAAQVANRYLKTGDATCLEQYDANRFRRRFRTRRVYRRVLANLQTRWLAEAACGLLRLPLAKRFVANVFFGRGSFPIERAELAPMLEQTAGASRRAL